MPKYRVRLETVASTIIEVEAEDKEAALDAAYNESMPRICAQCSGRGAGQNLELDDQWEIPQFMSPERAVEEAED